MPLKHKTVLADTHVHIYNISEAHSFIRIRKIICTQVSHVGCWV